ncbi:unnamed protein product [Orchesella dallaii]|uniref:Transmembrane protein n=1 Tax=Orchesella dallaii TaxID=48710 RepID=A0ABP1Q4K7_9HEXA
MNPCCCMSLQRGTLIFAWIDACLSFLLLILYTMALIGGIMYDPTLDSDGQTITSSGTQVIITCILSIVSCVCQIFLALYLRRAAQTENQKALRLWIIFGIILLLIGAINSAQHLYWTLNLWSFLSATAGITYKTYEIIVVYSFRHEVTTSESSCGNDAESEGRNLHTKEDGADDPHQGNINNCDCV